MRKEFIVHVDGHSAKASAVAHAMRILNDVLPEEAKGKVPLDKISTDTDDVTVTRVFHG